MNKHQFVDAFRQSEGWDLKSINVERYSYEALDVLYDYLDGIEHPWEYLFDLVAICGEWTEYETLEEAVKDWGYEAVDELERNTTVIPLTKGYLVQTH